MKKKFRLMIGIFILVIVGLVGYYEYRLSKFANVDYVTCYQVKNNINILEGQVINENMLDAIEIDKNIIPSNYISSVSDLKGKIASNIIYANEIITENRITDVENYYKGLERYVCLSANKEDNFTGDEIRPGDKIDILLFNNNIGEYINKDLFNNILVLDVKNAEGISYEDFKDNNFKIQHIYFKMDLNIYKQLIDAIYPLDIDFKAVIHGNRPKITKPSTNVNKGIMNID